MRKWRPYGSRTDPTAWLSVTNMFPTEAGTYRTANAFNKYLGVGGGPSSPGTTLTAWFGRTVAGTLVGYVGTTSKLYSFSSNDFNAGTFTDRTKSGGYTAVTWSFSQFGNITIATNGTDNVQARNATTSNAFADLAGSPPKAKIAVTQSNVLLLFGLNGAESSWAASDVGDHTNWSTGDAVSSTPILHRAGPITAAVAFRDEVVVFKSASMFRMRYVGSPVKWTVEMIADGIGAARMGSVCNCGSFVVFTGVQGAYIYDGVSVRPIGQGFNRSGTNLLEDAGSDTAPAIYYQASQHVLFKSDNYEGYYVYNVTSDAWGEFRPYSSTDGSALSGFVPVGSDVGAATYPQGLGNGSVVLVNLSADPCIRHDQSESENAVPATISTSLFGQQNVVTNFKRLLPIYDKSASWEYNLPAVTSFTCTPYTSSTPAGAETTHSAVNSSAGDLRFDFNVSARYARFNLGFNYAVEIGDVAPVMTPVGTD